MGMRRSLSSYNVEITLVTMACHSMGSVDEIPRFHKAWQTDTGAIRHWSLYT